MRNRPGFLDHRKKRIFFVPLTILSFLALSGVVWYLWNTVLPDVIRVRPLTYWEAICLLLLCRILFGSFKFGKRDGGMSFGGPPRHMREKWAAMTDEERIKFKAEWRERCRDRI